MPNKGDYVVSKSNSDLILQITDLSQDGTRFWCDSSDPFGELLDCYRPIAQEEYASIHKLPALPSIKEDIGKIQETILPCPHCGASSVDTEDQKAAVFFGGPARIPKYYKIQCYRCNASVEQSSVEAVIKIWNARC